MGMSFSYGPPKDKQEMITLLRAADGTRSHFLRYCRGLWAIHQ